MSLNLVVPDSLNPATVARLPYGVPTEALDEARSRQAHGKIKWINRRGLARGELDSESLIGACPEVGYREQV